MKDISSKTTIAVLIIIIICMAIAFIMKSSSSQQTENQLREAWEKDKKESDDLIKAKQAEIVSLSERYKSISKKMRNDSVRYSDAYNALKIEKARLNKRLNEINLKNSTTQQLDSIRSLLYGAGALHSN